MKNILFTLMAVLLLGCSSEINDNEPEANDNYILSNTIWKGKRDYFDVSLTFKGNTAVLNTFHNNTKYIDTEYDFVYKDRVKIAIFEHKYHTNIVGIKSNDTIKLRYIDREEFLYTLTISD